eukprot:s251_g25.t1
MTGWLDGDHSIFIEFFDSEIHSEASAECLEANALTLCLVAMARIAILNNGVPTDNGNRKLLDADRHTLLDLISAEICRSPECFRESPISKANTLSRLFLVAACQSVGSFQFNEPLGSVAWQSPETVHKFENRVPQN